MTDPGHLPNAPYREERSDSIAPLDGEPGIPSVTQPSTSSLAWKGIFAVALMVFSLVAVTAAAFNRAISGHRQHDETRRVGEQPIAATNEPRRLDMSLAASGPTAGAAKPVPAIVPMKDDADPPPIPLRRTGAAASGAGTPSRVTPEDAPVLLVTSRPGQVAPVPSASNRADSPVTDASDLAGQADPLQATKRNLEAYQRQLQSLLDTLSRPPGAAEAPSLPFTPALPVTSTVPPGNSTGLFGGQLQGSITPRVAAGRLSNRSLTLPKGTSFTCALRTRIISATSGMVGCQVQRNVYGDDGRVLLIERGSQVDGEYRVTSLRPGTVRIPVLWTRVRTPNGVIVNVESPATGPLGEAGLEGFVDNRWGERIGAAMLLSLIDDAVKLTIQSQANERQADTVILPSTTSNTSKLAEKVLDSTINIPPLIYQNQGGIVGVYVARDVDFSTVYELKAVPR